jgi:hypothetical protein
MAYNSREALRAAGILNGSMSPALEELFSSLTQEEAETLISVKQRADALAPDVTAHSHDWTKPEASQQGFEATTLCACGAWSGSGAADE